MENVSAVVLAAGKGTRMKSDLVKVMHPLAGPPMIPWPVAGGTGSGRLQNRPGGRPSGGKGTGVLCRSSRGSPSPCRRNSWAPAMPSPAPVHLFAGVGGSVLILCGDVPLIRPETLRECSLATRHGRQRSRSLTTRLEKPFGYGRIVKGEGGQHSPHRRRKGRDRTKRRGSREINSGIYCVEADSSSTRSAISATTMPRGNTT